MTASESAIRAQPRDEIPLSLLWISFALAGGLVEVTLMIIRKFVLDGWILVSYQVVWMAPLSYLVLLLPIAAILALARRRWPERITPRFATLVIAFVTIYSVLHLFVDSLHWASLLILSLGLASVVGRWIERDRGRFSRFARRMVPAMAVTTVLLTLALNGWLWAEGRRAMASLPAASARSNVLLIILDTVRAKSLSMYGYARPTTPNLERIAARGVRFERAVVTAPWSLPSHAGFFTGLYPVDMAEMDWGIPLGEGHPTLAEGLRDLGYETTAFMANSRYPRHEGGLSRGFLKYRDYLVSPGVALTSAGLTRALVNYNGTLGRALNSDWLPGRASAARVNGDLLDWLDDRDGSRPFFAFVNYIDAHAPYSPPEPFASRFAREPRRTLSDRLLRRERSVTPGSDDPYQQWVAREVDKYDGSVAYLDSKIGELMRDLEERGVLENTIVVIASDHGEQFDEHGSWGHGSSLEMTALHVPLMILAPTAVPAGVSVATPVSLRELPATILDLAAPVGPSSFPGKSLARFWRDSGSVSATAGEPVLSQLYKTSDTTPGAMDTEMMSIVQGRLHYVRRGDGREWLYDHESDPLETRDLAQNAAHSADIARLRRALAGMVPGWEGNEANTAAMAAAGR